MQLSRIASASVSPTRRTCILPRCCCCCQPIRRYRLIDCVGTYAVEIHHRRAALRVVVEVHFVRIMLQVAQGRSGQRILRMRLAPVQLAVADARSAAKRHRVGEVHHAPRATLCRRWYYVEYSCNFRHMPSASSYGALSVCENGAPLLPIHI